MSRPELPNQAPRPTALQWFFTADRVVLSMIALNSVVLFMLAFEELSHVKFLELLDYSFTTYFIVEVVLKIRRQTLRGYFSDSWNRFDFMVVVISIPSYALLLFPIPDLSFLLLLRVARAMKFFRFIRFVPDMPKLVNGAKRAIRASAVVLLAFFIFNFIFALISYHFFHPYSPEHFGNPLLAFYSTFKIFTVEGWYEVPDAIAQVAPTAVGLFARIYFMVVVIGGGLLGLSLVNAIFVDEMLRDETDDVERRLIVIDRLVERRFNELEGKLDLLLRAEQGVIANKPATATRPSEPEPE